MLVLNMYDPTIAGCPVQVPFTLDLPEDLFHGPRQRTKITVHKPIRPGDPEFKDVATLRKHCFDTVMVSFHRTPAWTVWYTISRHRGYFVSLR